MVCTVLKIMPARRQRRLPKLRMSPAQAAMYEKLITRIVETTSGRNALQAKQWATSFPLPGYGGRTAIDLILTDRGEGVFDVLDAIEAGVHY